MNAAGDHDPITGAPLTVWDHLGAVDVRGVQGITRHDVVEADHLPLSALALRRPHSSRLVVHLHGTLNRAKYTIPRFERLQSLSELDHNVLLLADGTLTLESSLATAWYIGSPEDSITERYAQLITEIATQWGIEHIVIAGASSGGFAALALAPRVDGALALAFSPQTRIRLRPTARPFQQFVFNRFGGWDGIEARPELRSRVDLAALYRERAGGCAWYIQNTGDAEHMERHARPFLTEHRERVEYVEEYHCPGHNPPNASRVVEWVQFALEHPDSDPREFIRLPPPEVEIVVR